MNAQVSVEDLPLSRFHVRTVFSGTGGQFSDGFVLGIIGIAVSMAAGPLQLNALWMGLLGAASLAGLFMGSLVAGPLADKFGRRKIFAWDMLLFAALSASQFFVTSPEQLLVLRLLLGLVLGFDYVVSKSLVTEFAPRRYRGRLLSVLAAAWAAGYVAAYLIGFVLRDLGPDAWRIMLAISGIPALLILPLRMGVPESPIWLMARGRKEEALAIIHDKFGPNVYLPAPNATPKKTEGAWAELFSKRWRKNTIVGCVFYTCQVIPFFALGTFAPRVLGSGQVRRWAGLQRVADDRCVARSDDHRPNFPPGVPHRHVLLERNRSCRLGLCRVRSDGHYYRFRILRLCTGCGRQSGVCLPPRTVPHPPACVRDWYGRSGKPFRLCFRYIPPAYRSAGTRHSLCLGFLRRRPGHRWSGLPSFCARNQ